MTDITDARLASNWDKIEARIRRSRRRRGIAAASVLVVAGLTTTGGLAAVAAQYGVFDDPTSDFDSGINSDAGERQYEYAQLLAPVLESLDFTVYGEAFQELPDGSMSVTLLVRGQVSDEEEQEVTSAVRSVFRGAQVEFEVDTSLACTPTLGGTADCLNLPEN